MYIITAIPLSKNNQKEYLSYFSKINVPLGHIISVPVRNKEIDALVIETEEVINAKSDLKEASFQLKKINKIKGPSPFSRSFFNSCLRLKDYYLSTTGAIIKSLSSSILLENISSLKKIPEEHPYEENIKQEKLIFQASFSDRLSYYKTLIREAFAKKESIFICLPTRHDIDIFSSELSRGIESYVFSLNAKLSKKELIKKYNEIIGMDHPVLIISTGLFLSIPRHDIKTVIVEKESSEAYKQLSRPYLDVRTFAEIYTYFKKIKLIFGDTLLRPEILGRYENGEYGEILPPIYRFSRINSGFILDKRQEERTRNWNIIGPKAKEIMDESLSSFKSVFVFTIRKGLAPITVCKDCGQTLLCPSCSSPLVLYDSKKQKETESNRIFMCNKCGRKEDTKINCPNCSSWNLVPLGIGIDKVRQELEEIYPNKKIFQLDKESAKTEKEAEAIMSEFHKNKGSILLGTNLALSFLNQTEINTSVITSLDGLFSIPSFDMTQKTIQVIEKLHHVTEQSVLIQTRIADNKILENILKGNILPIYREDLDERKTFNYPPFKRLIKITFEGTAKETEKARNLIEAILPNYEPQIYSAFIGKIKGHFITNTVIKVSPSLWPRVEDEKNKTDEGLRSALLNLPLSFSINVDPEDLL
jgi:primosomal protein N' (replication factor Y)